MNGYAECDGQGFNRRTFLKQASLATAAVSMPSVAAAAARPTKTASPLPKIRLGDREVTRLIAGYNPVGGYSHATPYLSKHMREYFTVERTVAFLERCEELGINTFQFDLSDKVRKVLDILRSRGSKLQFICLHAERASDLSIEDVIAYDPIAIVHHGGVTDAMFKAGKADRVHDFVKKVHDHGVLAGVSSHCPAHIARVEDEGWENSFYMTCFYYVSRTRADMEKEFGAVTVGEPYIESDPDKMTAMVRQVGKPCLGFKILCAGRQCGSTRIVGRAFQYAFRNIKATDAVIVGMFPRVKDEVEENVNHTMKYA